MATYQELRTRSQQVRDEQNIGGNTALRVGQLLMDIVKYFNDNDAAASEYLQQHFAMVNDGTQLLNWQQSPIVILHTMGETYDEGDFSSLSQGENYYRNGFIMEANGQGGGINGETPKVNVLYVNLANDTLYTWNGSSFDAITSGGGGSISGDDIIKNAYYSNGNLVLIVETESGDKTVSIPVNFDASNYVPTSRTVNGKALSNNITLSQSDIPGLVAALAALVPQTRTINGKALSSNVTIGMNDIQGLVEAIANAGSGAVSVTTNQDGTFVIHVGSTDYTINLNHTHENMAKIVKCTEATLPQTLADDTIYVQVDNLTTPTEIEKLYLFGLEFTGGGAAPGTPRMISPSNGSTINLGENDGSGVSGSVTIRGRDLTSDIVVSVSTGLSFDMNDATTSSYYNSVTGKLEIPKVDAINGVSIVVEYSGSGALADGSMVITHGNDVLSTATVIVEASTIEVLTGVKFTGTQWLRTDYYPNANTEFEIDLKIEEGTVAETSGQFLLRASDSQGSNRFDMNFGNPSYWYLLFHPDGNLANLGVGSGSMAPADLFTNHAIIKYENGVSNATFSFNGGTLKSQTVSKKTGTTQFPLEIGYDLQNLRILQIVKITIYRLTFYENGVAVRDYVPRSKNGVPGLLDVATNGTGLFLSSEPAKTSGLAADELVAVQ